MFNCRRVCFWLHWYNDGSRRNRPGRESDTLFAAHISQKIFAMLCFLILTRAKSYSTPTGLMHKIYTFRYWRRQEISIVANSSTDTDVSIFTGFTATHLILNVDVGLRLVSIIFPLFLYCIGPCVCNFLSIDNKSLSWNECD